MAELEQHRVEIERFGLQAAAPLQAHRAEQRRHGEVALGVGQVGAAVVGGRGDPVAREFLRPRLLVERLPGLAWGGHVRGQQLVVPGGVFQATLPEVAARPAVVNLEVGGRLHLQVDHDLPEEFVRTVEDAVFVEGVAEQQHLLAVLEGRPQAVKAVGGLEGHQVVGPFPDQAGQDGGRFVRVAVREAALRLAESQQAAFRRRQARHRDAAQEPAVAAAVEAGGEQLGCRLHQYAWRLFAEQGGGDAGGDLGVAEPRLAQGQPVARPGLQRGRFGQAGGEGLRRRLELLELLQQVSFQVAEAMPGREVRFFGAKPLRLLERGFGLTGGLELDELDARILGDGQGQERQRPGGHD